MMDEYIERTAAIAVLCEACGNKGCLIDVTRRCPYFKKMGDLPPADVKPVVRGEWNEIERGGLFIKYALFRCTHCGNIFKVYEDTLNAGRGDKNFCPNCGADMRPRENLKASAEYADADLIAPAT